MAPMRKRKKNSFFFQCQALPGSLGSLRICRNFSQIFFPVNCRRIPREFPVNFGVGAHKNSLLGKGDPAVLGKEKSWNFLKCPQRIWVEKRPFPPLSHLQLLLFPEKLRNEGQESRISWMRDPTRIQGCVRREAEREKWEKNVEWDKGVGQGGKSGIRRNSGIWSLLPMGKAEGGVTWI